jgi:cytochrome c553
MKKYLKWSAFALLMLLLVLQFFQINKTNPEIKPGEDFLVINKTEASTAKLLKDACYDCHSHETKYPWYTNVVPLSWWIKKHIVKGREELNFSTWATYTAKKADHKLEESIEMLEEKKMPLKSYVIAHSEAKLSADQIKQLSDYFRSQRKTGTENGNKEKSEAEDEDDKY